MCTDVFSLRDPRQGHEKSVLRVRALVISLPLQMAARTMHDTVETRMLSLEEREPVAGQGKGQRLITSS
jgi:hypothetical protein